MKLTNRAQRRKADKLGLLREVTKMTHKVTGAEIEMIVFWNEELVPHLCFIENEVIIYQVPAVDMIQSVAKMTNDAIDRIKSTIAQPTE